MLVDDLDFKSVSVPPHETHAVLIVDSNAVLASAITAQRLQLVPRWHFQIVEHHRRVQDRELLKCPELQVRGQAATSSRMPQSFGFLVPETRNHFTYTNVIQYYCQALV